MRRLTLTLTTLVLLISTLSIYFLQFLPSEPLHLRRNLTVYSVFVMIVSCLGMAGAIRRNPTLINLFASHLLLDALLYFIPRLLLLKLSVSLPTLFCTSSPPGSLEDLREAAVYRIHNGETIAERAWNRVYKPQWLEGESCRAWTWGLEVVFLSLMLIIMGAQVWCALRLRRYAQWIEIKDMKEKDVLRKEKEVC